MHGHFNLINNLLESFNLNMHDNGFICVSGVSSSIIDYTCMNFCKSAVRCEVFNAGISDQEADLCNVLVDAKRVKLTKKCGRLYTKINYSRFSQLCSNANWEVVLNHRNALEHFHNILSRLFDRAFPLTTIKNKKPWFTRCLKVLSRNMRSLHFLRKHFISNSIFISYYNKNIIYRKTIRAAKQIYFTTRISKSHNDHLDYWWIVNELCQRNKLVIDSKLISDELNI